MKKKKSRLPRGFGCFNFDDKESRQALIDTLYQTPLPHVARPGVFITGEPGSGKTSLASKIAAHFRSELILISWPGEEEFTKAAFALMEYEWICFDNLKGCVSSPAMEAFLSASRWSGRLLGTDRIEKREINTRVIFTGVTVDLSPEISRLVRHIKLKVKSF